MESVLFSLKELSFLELLSGQEGRGKKKFYIAISFITKYFKTVSEVSSNQIEEDAGKLQGVAKYNLRKYKSGDYSSENIILLEGTENLYQDVKNIYQQEFDEADREYNEKQKRPERRIDDYFEHVAKLDQDMAVEFIVQCGDKNFWEEHEDSKERMYNVYRYVLSRLQEYLPDFKIANAVIHFDEASPHMLKQKSYFLELLDVVKQMIQS